MEPVSFRHPTMPHQVMVDAASGKMESVLNAQITGFSIQRAHAFQFLTNAKLSTKKDSA
jgi:hypothetical protein